MAVIPARSCYKTAREGRSAVGTEGPAMADLYGGEVIHRVRAELVPHRRELRLYVLCRSGRGAWLARIAPFEELFFDEHLVRGLTVRQALARLAHRYPGCRRLVTLAG